MIVNIDIPLFATTISPLLQGSGKLPATQLRAAVKGGPDGAGPPVTGRSLRAL